MKIKSRRSNFSKLFIALLVTGISLFLISGLALAQTAQIARVDVSQYKFYLLPLVWNPADNTLKLQDSQKVTLTNEDLTRDPGTASQFYARVINPANQPEVFANGKAKLYLGEWKPSAGNQSTNIRITIPTFLDGQKVIIFVASGGKIAMSADVSQFAVANAVASANQGQSGQKKPSNLIKIYPKKQAATTLSLWAIAGRIIFFILVLGIIIVIIAAIIRKRRNRKLAQESSEIRNLGQGF